MSTSLPDRFVATKSCQTLVQLPHAQALVVGFSRWSVKDCGVSRTGGGTEQCLLSHSQGRLNSVRIRGHILHSICLKFQSPSLCGSFSCVSHLSSSCVSPSLHLVPLFVWCFISSFFVCLFTSSLSSSGISSSRHSLPFFNFLISLRNSFLSC